MAYVRYEIVSFEPFKAVGLELSLLGQRPAGQEGERTYERSSTTNEVKQGNTVAAGEGSSELDDLPF